MRSSRSRIFFLLLLGSLVSSAAAAQSLTKVPTDVILVKGAWSSASDNVTPLPEGGKVTAAGYDNPYFGLTLDLHENAVDVVLNGRQLYPQGARDHLVGHAFLHEFEDLRLARGQTSRCRSPGALGGKRGDSSEQRARNLG